MGYTATSSGSTLTSGGSPMCSGSSVADQLGNSFGEVVHAFEVFHDFGLQPKHRQPVRLICRQPSRKMVLGNGGQAVEFFFSFGHFASAFLVVGDNGADRPLCGSNHFFVQGAEHILGGLADLQDSSASDCVRHRQGWFRSCHQCSQCNSPLPDNHEVVWTDGRKGFPAKAGPDK